VGRQLGDGQPPEAATSGSAGQPSVTLTSGYDEVNNRTTLSDNLASAGLATYSYDILNRLTTMAQSFGGTAGPQVDLAYDAASRMTTMTRTIGGTGTKVRTVLSYDAANPVTTIQHAQVTLGGGMPPSDVVTPLATYTYGYDNADRVTSERNAEGTVTYGYDAANELTGASGSREFQGHHT
jgi:YD repeat-containing protein